MNDVLVQVLDSAEALDAHLVDYLEVRSDSMEFQDGKLILTNDGKRVELTPSLNFIRQLTDRIEMNTDGSQKKIADHYFSNIGNQRVADGLNAFMHSYNNSGLLFNVRAQSDHAIGALNPNKELINRVDLLDPFIRNLVVHDLDNEVRIAQMELMEDIVLRLVLRDYHGREHHGVGMELLHSLVGNSSTYLNPLVKTTSCDNSLVSRDSGIRINQSTGFGQRYTQAMRTAYAFVEDSIEQVELMESLYDVQVPLPSFLDYVKYEKRMRLTDPMIDVLVQGAREREDTLYGQVNGLTYLAGHFNDMPRSMQYDLEKLAGNIVHNHEEVIEYVSM